MYPTMRDSIMSDTVSWPMAVLGVLMSMLGISFRLHRRTLLQIIVLSHTIKSTVTTAPATRMTCSRKGL